VLLNGSPEFVDRALKVAVSLGIEVSNEDLQERYAELAFARDVRQ
jgi:hypothetical protein